MYFSRKKVRNNQPKYPVKIDRNNPLGASIQMLIMPVGGAVVDIANPNVIWTPTNATIKTTEKGMAMSMDGVDDSWSSSSDYAHITGNKGTFFFWAPRLTNGADGRFLILFSGSVYFGASATNIYNFGVASSGAYSPYGTNKALVYTSNGTAGTNKLFINGADSGVTWVTGPTAWAAGNKVFKFGAFSANTWDTDADVVIAGYSSRVWTETDAQAFYENPWQILQPEKREIWIPSVTSGITTIDGNPIVWQWETNNVIATEKIETTPTIWQWETTTGEIKEYIATTPVVWQWEVTTGDVQEGAAVTITGNPIAWQWEQGSASFVDKIETSPVTWQWEVTTGEVKEYINANTVDWQWATTTGQILGTDTIDCTVGEWQWEITTGNIVYLQPQVTGTIGGKKQKHIKQPYYESPYVSKLDLDEVLRDDSRLVSDLLAVDRPVSVDTGIPDGKTVEQDIARPEQSGILVGELLQKIATPIEQVQLEFPQIEESEGFDEETAVIMLLLAA